METDFLAFIDKAKANNKPIAYYTNREDSDVFSVGEIIAYDEDYILTSEISPQGTFDGYSLQKIETIYRMDIDDSYVNQIYFQYKKDEKEQLAIDDLTSNKSLLDSIVGYLKIRSDLVSFSLNKIRETDFCGRIMECTDVFLIIQIIDENKPSGETIIKKDSIFSIFWGNCD